MPRPRVVLVLLLVTLMLRVSSLLPARLRLTASSRRGLAQLLFSSSADTQGQVDLVGPSSEFSNLGILSDLVRGLNEQGWTQPTPVQKAVIPRLLGGENLVMAASTGSGKTLAFVLPALQKIATQEQQGYTRMNRRPRCLVLVPTRELARQVLGSVKNLSHFSKISSCAVLGGEQYGIQKKNLDRLIDIVVASPGRLAQHKEQGNVFLSQVDTVIIDEVDTMLMQGFGPDIRSILRSVMVRGVSTGTGTGTGAGAVVGEVASGGRPVQLVMATATLTKAVRALLTDVNGGGGFNINYTSPEGQAANKTSDRAEQIRVDLKIVEVDGLHRSLPNVRHMVEELKGRDKLIALQSLVQRLPSNSRTLLFCNSVASARAVQYHLVEAGTPALSYHGDLNSREREANLDAFRNGTSHLMVCTDIAARGLDIPEIDSVVMVDFPLNPIDYLHRAGRCGRAGRKGMVTSLVAKRDKILSDAIQGAIARGLPLDNLSSSKRDYEEKKGKLAQVVGRKTREPGRKAGERPSARGAAAGGGSGGSGGGKGGGGWGGVGGVGGGSGGSGGGRGGWGGVGGGRGASGAASGRSKSGSLSSQTRPSSKRGGDLGKR